MNDRKRVVITGIGVVSPAGIGRKKFWENIKRGRSAIKPVSLFDTSDLPHKKAGEITDFDIHKFFKVKGLRNLTRGAEFAFVASKLALEDAGLPIPLPDTLTDLCGVSLGSATGNIHTMLEFDKQLLTEGPRSVNPADFPNTAINAAASHLSITFNIKGFNATISTSLASGFDAIFYAINMIQNHGYKAALAGATEELTVSVYTGFSKLGCLASSDKQSKTKEISCPYDKRRNGLIFSEGSCLFVLEELGHALKRKAEIYAEIKGYGFSFDPEIMTGRGIAIGGAVKAIKQAIKGSGCPAGHIDYIAASANSMQRFDIIEALAIKDVFRERIKNIPVSAAKSIIGEAFSAGGVFNAATAIGALHGGFIPPTINYRFPDERCGLNIAANKAIKKRLNNVLINSFSNNGQNTAIVIGKYDG